MQLHVNGIHMATGRYLVEPEEIADARAVAGGAQPDAGVVGWLGRTARTLTEDTLGLPAMTDPAKPEQAGWGIVFSTEEDPAVRAALAPLVEHRERTGGGLATELDHLPGEEWRDWLARRGVRLGTVTPECVPYYLMLVGSPELIPFGFQYMLDIEYAVARLCLDSPAEYAAYAAGVVEYETSARPPGRRSAVFFGTEHFGDLATTVSATQLVGPLAGIGDGNGRAERHGFATRPLVGSPATKAGLVEALNDVRPALLFSATHGVGLDWDDEHQSALQGALVCQDWDPFTPVPKSACFRAADTAEIANVHGLVAFCFACFGAGTPAVDEYPVALNAAPERLAPAPFVSRLPKALLSHPQGAALAVVGHVERAWGCSIASDEVGPQLRPFENLLDLLLTGAPVGYAMRDFRLRHAGLTAELANMLEEMRTTPKVYSDAAFLANWVERNDARNFCVLGDPAVRLRVAELH